ncbi:kinase-like protein [Melanogaster broomeanus]|nr:kinase-like protein [Melanogaster broomeanus]
MSSNYEDPEVISEGPFSVVTRIETESPDGSTRFIAIKTSTTAHAKEPHDIVKEARLLALASHPNVIPLIKQEMSRRSHSLSLWMPYIPYSLDDLLQSSKFSPHPLISFGSSASSGPTPRELQFVVLAKSIMFQVLCGAAYLHSANVLIAHRDIKPSNVLLTASGRMQLIDFGIATRVAEEPSAQARDLWPEPAHRMYFEVSTGPYRAPELLFGPRTYDAFAIDAWSLGATLAELFTPLRLLGDEDDDDVGFPESDSDSGSDSGRGPSQPTTPLEPFIIPKGTRASAPAARWTRNALFDGSRGELGLAWSIFRTRGTPSENNWPSFLSLPDAGKVSFVDVGAVDLAPLLPNLPPSVSEMPLDTKTHTPSAEMTCSLLDLVHRFLVYEPSARLRPADALCHPWFTAEPGLVLPEGYTGHPPSLNDFKYTITLENQTRTLGDLLQMNVARQARRES